MYNRAENFVLEKTSDECLGLSYKTASLLAAKSIPVTFLFFYNFLHRFFQKNIGTVLRTRIGSERELFSSVSYPDPDPE